MSGSSSRSTLVLLCLLIALLLTACNEEPGEGILTDNEGAAEATEAIPAEVAESVDLAQTEAEQSELPVLVAALNAEQVDVLASALSTGYDIYSMQEEEIGEAEDFLLDTETGYILYLLVEYGGYAGIGATTIPIPLSALEWRGEERLVLRVPEEYLEGLGDVPSDWPRDEEAWDQDLRAFWAELGIEMIPGADEVTDVRRYSALFTTPAQGEEGGGVIADLVVDLTHGLVKYALIDFNESVWRVVPWQAIEAATELLAFSAELDPEALLAAPRVPVDLPVLHTDPTWDAEIADYWAAAGFPVDAIEEE